MKVYIKNLFLLAAIFTMVCCSEDIDFPLRGKLDEMATADGNVVDKYFPCSPSDLEWHYSWFDMSSIIQ